MDQRTKRLEVLLPVGPVFDELLDVALGPANGDAVYFSPYKVLEFLIVGFAPLPYPRGFWWHRQIVSSVGWILRLWLLVAT
jgi:hypothetical protein